MESFLGHPLSRAIDFYLNNQPGDNGGLHGPQQVCRNEEVLLKASFFFSLDGNCLTKPSKVLFETYNYPKPLSVILPRAVTESDTIPKMSFPDNFPCMLSTCKMQPKKFNVIPM